MPSSPADVDRQAVSAGGMLAAALAWAGRGYRVLPLQENRKEPVGLGWVNSATTDAEVIKQWWRDPVTGLERGWNVGFLTTDWIVLDIDVKDGKPGLETFFGLGLGFDTLTMVTPSGGYHVVYRGIDERVSNAPLGPGLDVRSHNGYVVAPGSTINGQPYEVAVDLPVAEFPKHLRGHLKPPRRRAEVVPVDFELDTPELVGVVSHWLRDHAPRAVQGANGDDTTYRVACRVRDLGVTEPVACDLMLDEYNERCSPPWEPHELRLKVENAYRYATGEAGARSAEAAFGHVVPVACPAPSPTARGKLCATPFVWSDPRTFPRREWLFGTHLIRRFVSATIAPGGSGKTILILTEAVSMASGRNITGTACRGGPLRVWVANLEDPREEIERRVLAICQHHRIDPTEIEGRLFLDSGREVDLVLAKATRGGVEVEQAVVADLAAEIARRKIDVLVVDPLVKAHAVDENDNGAVDRVVTAFARVADLTGCAVELVHHARKTGGAEVAVEDGRGASALLAGVRSARVLNVMNKDEAEKAQIDEKDRRSFFRITNGKANLAPPLDESDWFRLQSVALGNGDPRDPLDQGDSVGVVECWTWPQVAATDLSDAQRAHLQEIIGAGEWRADSQCRNWAGLAVAQALEMVEPDKTERIIAKQVLKSCVESGVLRVVSRKDRQRKSREFVEVGSRAAPPLQGGADEVAQVAQKHCATTPLL